jgi:hypothetical protein
MRHRLGHPVLPTTLRRTLPIVLVVVGLLVTAFELAHSPWVRGAPLLDARAIICVGRAVDAGADAYATEPARTCQHAIGIGAVRDDPQAVMGFALPGYVLPLFGLLARLPVEWALVVFAVLVAAALFASIALLIHAFGLPPALTVAALAFAAGFPSLSLGQLGTFELVAIVSTAAALQARRDALAGLLGAAALLEPHVGGFVGLALLVWVPRARLTFLAGAFALGAIAIASAGLTSQEHWLLRDLPLIAQAELHQGQQYSAAYLASWFGASPRLALAIGGATTLVMLVTAIVWSGTLRGRVPGMVALLPAACATVGGTYIHYTQISAAIPAALVLLPLARTRAARALCGLALILLTIPWLDVAAVKQLLAPALTTVGVLVWSLSGGSWRRTAAALVACWLVLWPVENHPPAPLPPAPHVASVPGTISSAQAWLLTHGRDPDDLWHLLVKVPTWLGLIALLAAAGLYVRRPEDDRIPDAVRPSLARGSASGAPTTASLPG